MDPNRSVQLSDRFCSLIATNSLLIMTLAICFFDFRLSRDVGETLHTLRLEKLELLASQ